MNGFIKRYKKRKTFSLPPHSWEAHPPVKGAAANKPFVIAILTIALVVVLLLFLFFGAKFIGKAYEVAGGHEIDIVLTAENNLEVWATVTGTSANGVYFELSSGDIDLCQATVVNRLWEDFEDISCTGSTLIFSDATLNDDDWREGTFVVAELTGLTFPAGRGEFTLDLMAIDVYDAVTGSDLFPAGDTFTLAVPLAVPPPPPAPGDGEEGDEDMEDEGLVPDLPEVDVLDEDMGDGEPPEVEMRITSSEFDNLGIIPDRFTCDGENVNPSLVISNIPVQTRSIALFLDDPDFDPALPAVHWAVLNIPISTQVSGVVEDTLEISENINENINFIRILPAASIQANEVDGQMNYTGPCPPAGETHRYRFKAYALNVTSVNPTRIQDVSSIVRARELEEQYERNILSEATLNGYYYPPPAPAPGGVSSGGGGGCITRWSCPQQWGFCNATLQQSRTCTDLNRCDSRKLTKLENRSCAACEESWVCTSWSSCQSGRQVRQCTDEHSCLTTALKPAMEKSCQIAVAPGPAPVRVTAQPPQLQQPAPPALSLWDRYKVWMVAIPAVLAVIALSVLGALHFLARPRQYNFNELKGWIGKEQQMGTSVKDIKEILGQHTGWSREDIENSFAELKEKGPAS